MSSVVVPPSLAILSSPPPPPTPMGLIAGGGRLPILIAQSLRDAGHPVHGLGLCNQFEPELPGLCSTFRTVGLLRIGSWGRILSSLGVHHAIMVGKVDKAKLMHDPWRIFRNLPDWAAVVSWYKHLRHDKRSHAVLSAVAAQLNKSGVTLLDSTAPIPDEMATIGTMTSKGPGVAQQADIDFAWPLLAHTLRLDIGQAIAVRERDVIAVEAVEGTDRMIERAGKLCRAKGWTLVKGARIGHDRRADVPTVGVNTIRNLHAHGGTCLALAAGDVIMLDKEEMIRLGDRLGVAIVGVERLHGVTDEGIKEEAKTADISIADLVGAESVSPIVISSERVDAAAESPRTDSAESEMPSTPSTPTASVTTAETSTAKAEQSVAS